jgi:hypothetical protein
MEAGAGMNKTINDVFLRFSQRAESEDQDKLVETFVDAAPLLTLLSSQSHQIIHGRRGTGKTHALKYLAEQQKRLGDLTVYVDMRLVGSTGGIYGDTRLSLSDRATRLLADALTAVHDTLLAACLDDDSLDLSALTPPLDAIAESITGIEVVEDSIEVQQSEEIADSTTDRSTSGFGVTQKGFELKLADELTEGSGTKRSSLVKTIGVKRHRIHFGQLAKAFADLMRTLRPKRVWILLDEWSAVPMDLQPYLADLIKRSLLPQSGVTVKIAAIEQRSEFQIPGTRGDYIGFEEGADLAAGLNLDDFMVFDNAQDRATEFFQEMLFRHFVSACKDLGIQHPLQSAPLLVQAAFTQRNAFEEFTKATEGVPRDGLYILAAAAQKALTDKISIPHIRAAAKTWYGRGKEGAIPKGAKQLLYYLIDEVIKQRKARAFLLRTDVHHELIEALFDARVIHLLKKNISSNDQPGVRFNAYKLDYGCYVDLLATAKAPVGLLPGEVDGVFVDVPDDDYRAIRRAVLDVEKFDAHVGHSLFAATPAAPGPPEQLRANTEDAPVVPD